MKIISVKPALSGNFEGIDAIIELTKGKDIFLFDYANHHLKDINNTKQKSKILKKCERFCHKKYDSSLDEYIEENKFISTQEQIILELFGKSNDECDDEVSTSTEVADNLPDGWYWNKHSDGSGSLRGPNGEDAFSYDLSTGEYWDYFGKIQFMPNYPLPTNFPEYKAFAEKEMLYILKTECAA